MNKYQRLIVFTTGIALSFATVQAKPALAVSFNLNGTLLPSSPSYTGYSSFTGTYSIDDPNTSSSVSSYNLIITGMGMNPISSSSASGIGTFIAAQDFPQPNFFALDFVNNSFDFPASPGDFDLTIFFQGTPSQGTLAEVAFSRLDTYAMGINSNNLALQRVASAESNLNSVTEPSSVESIAILGLVGGWGWLMKKKVQLPSSKRAFIKRK